jgi:tetratricopeptide (TPR) repeat protein
MPTATLRPIERVETLADLGRVLRELRRRHARGRGGAELTYRELAAATGWSHGIIGEYLGGKVLPPTERFDVLIRLLGATSNEQGALATARDRVEERRRGPLPTGPAVPRQLPADVYGFAGRQVELAALDRLLLDVSLGGPVVISALSGTAGVGKTSLAVRWAHRVAGHFPDGQLYLDLRGYDPDQPVAPASALANLLRGLGVSAVDIPADLAERSARYRTLLADRRVLVLLDNARTAEQVRPLLPGARTCLVVVTSRDDLAGLVVRDGARRIDLDVLTEPEAVSLLRTLIGPRVEADPSAAAALAQRCARLPLALRIAAELAAARPAAPLRELVADLADERLRLDLFDRTGDPRSAVRAVFSWSYQHLRPAVARAFGLAGLHPGPFLDAFTVAALVGADSGTARAGLDELVRAHLVAPVGPGRYAMHDLLRAYAVEQVDPVDGRAALTRLLDAHRHSAYQSTRSLFPHDERPLVATDESPVDGASAQRWLDEQRPNLIALATHAARHGWPEYTVDLSQLLWRYLEVGGHYQDALTLHTLAAEVVPPHDGRGRAAVLANLGGVHWWLGRYSEAMVLFGQSLDGYHSIDDEGGQARALARLGVVHERLGDYDRALARMREALGRYRRIGHRHGEGAQLVNIGNLYRRIGRYQEAAEHQRAAVAVFDEVGDERLRGYALGNLGAVCSRLGLHGEALVHLQQALSHCLRTADRGGEGSARATIGAAHALAGRPAAALKHLHRALAISRETADRGLETETLNSLGETLHAMGEPESAATRHRAALALAGQTGDRYERARAHDGLALALLALDQLDQADEHRREARAIAEALGCSFSGPVSFFGFSSPDSELRSR